MTQEELPPAVSVPLHVKEHLDVPAFANLVRFNNMTGPEIGEQVILSFFHVYLGKPPGPGDEAAKGEAVARVTMTRETARALRNLLIRQLGELERINSEGEGEPGTAET